MREYEAAITRTEKLGADIYQIEVTVHELAGSLMPGQFVQIRTVTATDPFLRRTVSVSGVDRRHGIVRLLVDVVGPGTRALCSVGCGGTVNVIGPLGRGFDTAPVDGPIVFVAGGIGVAPLLFLVREFADSGRNDLVFLMGGRHQDAIGIARRFMPGAARLEVATDDGSAGHHGFVTDLLGRHLAEGMRPVVYACGPYPMMHRIAMIAAREGIRCQVSLEERMACGIGACYGCAVEMTDGTMKRVCVDGPVFESGTILWKP